ncbi:MAG: DEAD/DEAH box helicase, partial [Actinomycetales bacterium]
RRDLSEAYLRYIDTAYWLRDEALMQERRRILTSSGLLMSDCLLEPVLPYEANDDLLEAASVAGVEDVVAEAVGQALFGAFTPAGQRLRLRSHQEEAVRHHFRSGTADGRNVVVTSGTGSGKTESFLLPILMRLAQEARTWDEQPDPDIWWGVGPATPPWRPVRGSETRPAAMRSMILYPTNALVEDQITRLRRAVRHIGEGMPGRPLWFGRYTGVTLGSGAPKKPGSPAYDEVLANLQAQQAEFERLQATGRVSEEDMSQFPDPTAHEMVLRWDMVATPPDILVTNYSMLNAMLMREREERMFASTRTWLASDADHVFTLVVDELHLYRGTQGSEVAMVVRNLLSRLGLDPKSPQLRVIATSASLSAGPEGTAYLEQFFGVDGSTFHVTAGAPVELPPL